MDLESVKDSALEDWRVVSDQEAGGKSFATVRFSKVKCDEDPSGWRKTIVFEGVLHGIKKEFRPKAKDPWFVSPEKEEDKELIVDGYAAFMSPQILNDINVDPFEIFTLKMRSCGKKYFFNVAPENSFWDDDLYQALIGPDENPVPDMHERWVDMQDLTQTVAGQVKGFYSESLNEEVSFFSIGVEGRGPFRFELEFIEGRMKDYKLLEEMAEKERIRMAHEDAGKTGMTFEEVRSVQRSDKADIQPDDPVFKEYLERADAEDEEEQRRN